MHRSLSLRNTRGRMRALQAAGAFCLTAALLIVATHGHSGRSLAAKHQLEVPKLTNETLLLHLRAVATPRREIIYTTTSAWSPAITDMIKNFMYHMHAVGRDGNTMIISQDVATCENLQAQNMPCYLDDVSPKSWEFPEGHRYGERPWDFGKIWWSLRLAQLGYTSLYLDNDVAATRDPLAPDILQTPYDLQGLSDFRDPELPRLGSILDNRCALYREKLDKSIPGGDIFHPTWEIKSNETSLRALAPCQSLAVYYVRPTPAAMKFLAKLADWVVHTHTQQWDQAAWNEVVMGFLVGMGAEEPLRYRILPINEFMNLEIYEKRKAENLHLQPVLLHAGYLNKEKKMEKYQELGIWRGDVWEPAMGQAGLVTRLKACGGSLAKCRVPRSPARVLSWLALVGAVTGAVAFGCRWAYQHHGSGSLLPTTTRTGH